MSEPRTPSGARSLADTRRALLAVRERQRASARGTGDTVTPVGRDRPLPLSFSQQRLWFLAEWMRDQPVYNAPVVLRLSGRLDRAGLNRAVSVVADRHEVLRTRFPVRDGVAYQDITPAGQHAELAVTDVSAAADPQAAAATAVAAAVRRPFDLTAEHAFRPSLVLVGAEEHLLVLAMHHIATDGWSSALLLRELVEAYRAEQGGTDLALPSLPVQYADFAVWQRGHLTGEVLDKQVAYWRDRLTALPTLDLPADRPRPADPTRAGATLERTLPLDLQSAVHATARAERVTALSVVLAAFTALMTRYTGQDDIVVGSILSGRTRAELEPLIGFFANTVVLRTSTDGDPDFRELLARTNETVLGAHFHQDVPFGHLVDELAPERDPSRNPLFQVCFTLQTGGPDSGTVGDLRIDPYPAEAGTARFDLAVQLLDVPGAGLRLWMEYSTELFDADRMHRLLDHYQLLLTAALADPGLRLSELPLLTSDEAADLIRHGTGPVPDLGTATSTLPQLFEAVADQHPDIVALRFAGADVTYAELDARANRLAHRLRAAGVRPETVVGVLAERGPVLPEGFLGVLKAGGAYLALDPDHPPARREQILAKAGATLVVTTRALAGELPDGVTAVLADDSAESVPDSRPEPLALRPNLAYVVFTSGSTGQPKGVQVEHRSIVDFVAGIIGEFRLGPGDRILQYANPCFDVSLFDFFAALCSGATLVQASREILLDVGALGALLRDERVTVADLPPAVLGLLDPSGLPDLRALFVGLEAFSGALVNDWMAGGREFHNGYGPTEATVACVDHRCSPVHHDAMPPIGRPLPHYRAHVVDRSDNLVPVGVPGELLVGGGLARGYASDPRATALKFVPDPFGGDRLYRTGDLVCRRADGNLEFLGRVDDQISLRGLRVEPAEIEQAVLGYADTTECVVVLDGHGEQARLVAYVVPAAGARLDEAGLRAFLGTRLPAYLVPAVVVELPELPRGASGKLDRRRLPAPGGVAVAVVHQAPGTDTQRRLAGVWTELLGVAEPGIHDSFFAAGGNSLKITQLGSRIRDAFGVELELRELFTHTTIAQLADLIEARELAGLDAGDLAALLAEDDAGEVRA
ncbi:amino acid adenylation domain-containing protein [Actinoplanes sp. NPDC051859]|uniref:amino acid adenylation domain-containing protein n=1 Tax=Actinoplanes sp. NPDC051859 TaxID=3363909 RepID=UPI0037AB6FF8